MNMNRKLATIRKIDDIMEIHGSDFLVCAVVDGWSLVTQKANHFKAGDLVVYFEIDSVLPEREEFEFLRDRCYVSAQNSVNGAGFRLKTIRLRGVYSQGLILPINSIFSEVYDPNTLQPNLMLDGVRVGDTTEICIEGYDLTDVLGVVKYEKPLPANLGGVAKGNFPTFIPKTDQERIQNCFKYLHRKWVGNDWEVTMKLDGSSMTVYHRTHEEVEGHSFGVCSRNLDLVESEGNAFWQVARKLDIEQKLADLGLNIAIQGELMGPGVQGNKEGLSELDLYVFDIWDIDNQRYLIAEDRYRVCETLGIQHAPIVNPRMNLDDWSLADILEMADGPSIKAKLREGLVFKSLNDPSISFKAISNKWLLKTGE